VNVNRLTGILFCIFIILQVAHPQTTPYHINPVFGTELSALPQPPYRFGEIPLNQLLMREYAADKDASAVILFDFGSVYIDGDQNVVYQRHRRIKILKPDGFLWGHHEIPYYTRPISQYVRGIEGMTVILPATGSEKIYKFDPSTLIVEMVSSGKNKIRFTLPALEAGAVIEYRYEIVSENPTQLQYWDYQTTSELKRSSSVEYRYDIIADQPGLVPDWEFQTSESVLWSEYNLRVPEFLEYAYVVSSNQPFHLSTSVEYVDGPSRFHRGKAFRWVRKDMPAIREEPFITTMQDYISKITFQLAAWYHPQGIRIQVLDTWQELVDRLARARELGGQISPRRSIRRITSSLTETLTDPVQILEKVHDYVRTTVSWNGQYGIFTSDRVDRIHDSKTGNSADIGLLLVSMLRAADLDAHPLLLSTRDNGRIQNLYPMRDQFNHVIAHVAIDGDTYLLDATNPLYPINVLPYNTLNVRGLLIKRGELTWVPLEPSVTYSRNIWGTIDLDNDAILTARIQVSDDGYAAVSTRRMIQRDGEIALVQSLLGNQDIIITVDSLAIIGMQEVYDPLETFIEFSSDDHVETDDSLFYMIPTLMARINENPFTLENRTYPVDFAFLRESLFHVHISVPDEYEIVSLPQSIDLSQRDGSTFYTREVTYNNGVISYQRSFAINKTLYLPGEYRRLRGFFNQVVAMESQKIVFSRKVESDTIVQ
jgi:hypothetical protein